MLYIVAFSLVACQDAAPISDEPLDQQELIENATTYFNQMLAGDFDTLYSDLPKVFKKILLLKQYKLIGTKKLKKLVDCPKIQHQTSPVMCQKKVSNIVWSLLFPVKREISRYSLTIP